MKLGTRIWTLVTVIVIIGLLAGGWFLGASPLLQAQATAERDRQAAVAQNANIELTIAKLETAKDNIGALQQRAAELEVAIPRDVESAAFISSLNDLASANAVTISSIAIGDGLPYTAPAGDEVIEGAPRPVTDSRITEGNFVLVPVTIEVIGGWNEVLGFVNGVQTGSRLVLATRLDTSASGGLYTTTIAGAMYVLERKAAPATPAGETEPEEG